MLFVIRGFHLLILYVEFAVFELVSHTFNYALFLFCVFYAEDFAFALLVFCVDFVLEHLELPLVVDLVYIYLTLNRFLNILVFNFISKEVKFLAAL